MNRMSMFVFASLVVFGVVADAQEKKPVRDSTNIKINPGSVGPTKDGLVPMPLDPGEEMLTIGVEKQPGGAPLHTLKVILGEKQKNGFSPVRGTYEAGYVAGSGSSLTRHRGIVRGSIGEDGRLQLILLRQRGDNALVWEVAPHAKHGQLDGGVIVFEGNILNIKNDDKNDEMGWLTKFERNKALEETLTEFGEGRALYERAKIEATADKK